MQTPKRGNLFAVALLSALTLSAPVLFAQEAASTDAEKATELAQKLANPVSSMISVPFQFNFDNGYGADSKGSKFVMNVQPVIPISMSENWNVIWRNIMPVVYQSDVIPNSSQGGFGDFTESFFFSPKESGVVIWGVGPVLMLPTATDDRLGSEKWSAGPTAVVLKQTGGWTYGALVNHLWDFEGNSQRDNVNLTYMQPFVAFTTKTATTFTLNTETTYNWDAKSDHWSVPVNFTVSQLMKIGKLPVSLTGGLGYWAESPQYGPEGFRFRFAVTLLFPK